MFYENFMVININNRNLEDKWNCINGCFVLVNM